MSRKPAEPTKKEQNEYIPSFISKKPFYLESNEGENDYLEHQRLHGTPIDQSKWYERGKRAGPAATKYRKGACENCGAITHKTKDCLSRPRAKGAKWTGKDIQADEIVEDVQLGWDAKRDRWNGYDAGEYKNVVEEFEDIEAMKQILKRSEGQHDSKSVYENEQSTEVEKEEEAKYAEESDMGREQSTATRNLRMREDTAKYLLNLDLESAKYDPKTRSMVDMGAEVDQAAALVAEDNFMRASGDAAEFARAQKLAWESQERGDKNKVHLQANPTSGEYFRRKEEQEKDVLKEKRRKDLLEKYGGEQYLGQDAARRLAVQESSAYVEYDASGEVRGAKMIQANSKYAEDILVHNHTSVWGSWWSNFAWGYECCHSTMKNSFCVGNEGKLILPVTDQYTSDAANQRVDDVDDGRRVDMNNHAQSNYSAADDILNVETNVKKRGLLDVHSGPENTASKKPRTEILMA